MDQASDTFWDSYRTLVSRLLRPIGKKDGFSEARVAEAERQIGLPLPRLLREVYRLTGQREDIHAAHDRLLPPEDIGFQDDVLVFYEENQAVCLWGIRTADLGHDDPPVLRQDSTANPTWEPDNDRLSEFLTAMLFW